MNAIDYLKSEYNYDEQDMQMAFVEWGPLKSSLEHMNLMTPENTQEEQLMKQAIDNFMADRIHENKRRRRSY